MLAPQDSAPKRVPKPVIGVVCDVREEGGRITHGVVEKYLYAVAAGADATPLLLPARISDLDGMPAHLADLDHLLDILDGIFLPGSPSNVAPDHYGSPDEQVAPADPHRDALSLALIRRAVARRVPLFGVCRGFQEINVALGGTLCPALHMVDGRRDHRHDEARPLAEQYAGAHDVTLASGGLFSRLAGAARWHVNSLHGQGVELLADGLAVEAVADDGTIEAFRLAHDEGGFCLATQWHPEWRFAEDRLSTALFRLFGEAARGAS